MQVLMAGSSPLPRESRRTLDEHLSNRRSERADPALGRQFNDTGRGLYQLSSSLKPWIAELISQGASPDLCRQPQSYRGEIEVTNPAFIDSGNVDLLPEEVEDVRNAISMIKAALSESRKGN